MQRHSDDLSDCKSEGYIQYKMEHNQTSRNFMPTSSTELEEISQLDMLQQQINTLISSVDLLQEDIDDELTDKFCDVCSQLKGNSELLIFCCDEHRYCDTCINSIISDALQNYKVVKCPHETCMVQFNQESPFFHTMLDDIKIKYLKIVRNKKVLENPNMNLCAVPDCIGFVLFDVDKIECSECKKEYCNKCREYAHDGKCDRLIIRSMEKKYKFRKCPQCKMVVQKNEGCDHMTCLCTHQFCYKCGQSYIHGAHTCAKPWHLRGFAGYRWTIQRQPTFYETDTVNLSRILYYLDIDSQFTLLTRFVLTLLFTAFVYPIISSLAIGLVLLAVSVYYGLILVVVILYFIFLPLTEIWHLQLGLARRLRNKNLPKWLVRLLMIPAYPLNLIIGICSKTDVMSFSSQTQRFASIFRIISFFLVLPCLINTDAAQ